MQKRISAADDAQSRAAPIRVVVVTMDSHLAGAAARAETALRRDLPGLRLVVHAADEWGLDAAALSRCKADIEQGDIIVASMLFLEEHVKAVLPTLQERRGHCDAMIGFMSAPDIVKLTRMNKLSMAGEAQGALALLKRLRGSPKAGQTSGQRQMTVLRQMPRLLRFIPGTAQDLRAYFLALQFWLAGSQDNIANLVRLLVDRYADGDRRVLRGAVKAGAPIHYPDVGLYHPDAKTRIVERLDQLPASRGAVGTVGLLVMRSYVLAGNSAHYDGVIQALEARGLRVVPAFASGLDSRPAIERYFLADGRASVDAVVSLTGFSLVGGPAYNDAKAAEAVLSRLDVPYIAAHPVEFQTIEQWRGSDRGLSPVEATIMVAIPELDGSTGPIVFGGRTSGGGTCTGCVRSCVFPAAEASRDMHVCSERAEVLAARTGKTRRAAAGGAGRAARRDRPVQLSAQRREHRHGRVPVRLRLAPSASRRHEGRGLRRGCAGKRGRAAHSHHQRQRGPASAQAPT
jgi:magnesium chelatase subunit H